MSARARREKPGGTPNTGERRGDGWSEWAKNTALVVPLSERQPRWPREGNDMGFIPQTPAGRVLAKAIRSCVSFVLLLAGATDADAFMRGKICML